LILENAIDTNLLAELNAAYDKSGEAPAIDR